MKLSKKNAARQLAIQKTIASGKALGGLLVGLTAATVVGGCKDPSPARTMGIYPMPQQQANATNENKEVFVTEGAIAVPKTTTPPPMPNAVWEQPNAVWEQRGETITTMGIMPARGTVPPKPKPNVVNEDKKGSRPRLLGVPLPSKPRETQQK